MGIGTVRGHRRRVLIDNIIKQDSWISQRCNLTLKRKIIWVGLRGPLQEAFYNLIIFFGRNELHNVSISQFWSEIYELHVHLQHMNDWALVLFIFLIWFKWREMLELFSRDFERKFFNQTENTYEWILIVGDNHLHGEVVSVAVTPQERETNTLWHPKIGATVLAIYRHKTIYRFTK